MIKQSILYAALTASVLFFGYAVWNLIPGDPNLGPEFFTGCARRNPDDLQRCHLAQALFRSNELAVAACRANEGRKIQNCHPVRNPELAEDTAGKFRTTLIDKTTDVTISTLINYDNDWGRVQIAYLYPGAKQPAKLLQFRKPILEP